jgi:hypothetical protein
MKFCTRVIRRLPLLFGSCAADLGLLNLIGIYQARIIPVLLKPLISATHPHRLTHARDARSSHAIDFSHAAESHVADAFSVLVGDN